MFQKQLLIQRKFFILSSYKKDWKIICQRIFVLPHMQCNVMIALPIFIHNIWFGCGEEIILNVGNQVSNIRKENQLTQEEFGKLFYVTRQTVSNWENGVSQTKGY